MVTNRCVIISCRAPRALVPPPSIRVVDSRPHLFKRVRCLSEKGPPHRTVDEGEDTDEPDLRTSHHQHRMRTRARVIIRISTRLVRKAPFSHGMYEFPTPPPDTHRGSLRSHRFKSHVETRRNNNGHHLRQSWGAFYLSLVRLLSVDQKLEQPYADAVPNLLEPAVSSCRKGEPHQNHTTHAYFIAK